MSSAQVPEGYKQTEVGVIPDNWKVAYLEEVSKLSSGTTPSRAQENRYYRNGEFHWVKTTDLNNSQIKKTEEKVTREALDETCLQVYSSGTVLVAMYGGFNQIGRTGLIIVPAAVNQALIAIQATSNKLDPAYLLATLNYRVEYWKSVASSSRKDPNITSQDVKNFVLALPEIQEQRLIAQALSDVDALIASLDKLIAKQRHLKTAAMQQLLTGKMRSPGFSEGKGYKQTEIGMIPEDWKVLKLKDIAPLQRGFDLPTSLLQKGDYPVVYSNGVMNHHAKFMVDGPGVITGRSGTIGNVHYVSENYWPHNTALWVTDFVGSHPKYIYYLYKSLKLERFGTGSGVPTLNRNDVHDSEVAIPQLEEQRMIATVLSDMDTAIAALETRRAKTQAIKQGMMQELLTGRTRLV
jgi:type I restriction enzyme, S subunit